MIAKEMETEAKPATDFIFATPNFQYNILHCPVFLFF